MNKNNILYVEKSDPWSSHSIIYDWLCNYQPGAKILDIGAATGLLGKKLEGFGFYIKGLEPVIERGKYAAGNYDEIEYLTIDQAPEEFLEKQDVVVCADVLEHLTNPEEELKRLIKLQKPDTQFIISVPNVAHIWIRLNLLFGKFNYTDVGILDRTHLRFFTKKTFLQLLISTGLSPIEIKYTSVPLSRVNRFFLINPMGRFIQRIFAYTANLLPGLFAYQIVTRSVVKDCDKDNEP